MGGIEPKDEHEIEVFPGARRALFGSQYVAHGFVDVGFEEGARDFSLDLSEHDEVAVLLEDLCE